VKIRAPAKVNLRLRVVGKRQDGYHLLDTIMVPVSLFDEIEIIKITRGRNNAAAGEDPEVTCDHPLVPAGEKNLAYRAARLLLKEKNIRERVRIHIAKRIPVGAGLGGGSSDAAAVLLGLNRLLRFNYSLQELEKISLSLGADVPFFIKAAPARARGIGERLSAIKHFPRLSMVILYPGFPVSAAWVYRNLRLKLTKQRLNNSINFSHLSGSPEEIRRLLVNDLETVTVRRYPKIGLLKENLTRAGAVGSLMSGSGSSVFGVFDSRQRAKQALCRLREEEGTQAFLVQVLRQRRR
jgi:4-diphosphocytidyl-2-C-methyl-D-erythritol kinase